MSALVDLNAKLIALRCVRATSRVATRITQNLTGRAQIVRISSIGTRLVSMGVVSVVAFAAKPTRLHILIVPMATVVGFVYLSVDVTKVGCGLLLLSRFGLRLRRRLSLLLSLLKLPLD